ncbi:MAG: hypothetical protein ACI83P_001167 [Janthinobacterium sp.]|jgi:hypothetical protein
MGAVLAKPNLLTVADGDFPCHECSHRCHRCTGLHLQHRPWVTYDANIKVELEGTLSLSTGWASIASIGAATGQAGRIFFDAAQTTPSNQPSWHTKSRKRIVISQLTLT